MYRKETNVISTCDKNLRDNDFVNFDNRVVIMIRKKSCPYKTWAFFSFDTVHNLNTLFTVQIDQFIAMEKTKSIRTVFVSLLIFLFVLTVHGSDLSDSNKARTSFNETDPHVFIIFGASVCFIW